MTSKQLEKANELQHKINMLRLTYYEAIASSSKLGEICKNNKQTLDELLDSLSIEYHSKKEALIKIEMDRLRNELSDL